MILYLKRVETTRTANNRLTHMQIVTNVHLVSEHRADEVIVSKHPWDFGSIEESICIAAGLMPTGGFWRESQGNKYWVLPPTIQIDGTDIHVQQIYQAFFPAALN